MSGNLKLVILLLLSALFKYSELSGIFTSVSHMRYLVKQESAMLDKLKIIHEDVSSYTKLVEDLIFQVETNVPHNILDDDSPVESFDYVDDYSAEASFIKNPINAFKMIMRIVDLWSYVLERTADLQNSTVINDFLAVYEKSKHPWPDMTDKEGVEDSFERLREYTKLSPLELAHGDHVENYGIKNNVNLDVLHILNIGKRAYHTRKFAGALEWLQLAYDDLQENHMEDSERAMIEFEILDYMSWASYYLGNYEKALVEVKKLHAIAPQNPRIQENMRYFEQLKSKADSSEKKKSLKQEFNLNDDEENINKIPLEYFLETKERNLWLKDFLNKTKLGGFNILDLERELGKHICSGKNLFIHDRKDEKELICHLRPSRTSSHPEPYEIEMVHENPNVYVIYNFLDEEEMEELKYISGPQLKRATVNSPITGKLTTATYRISKSSWHPVDESPVVKKVHDMVEDFSDLTLDYSEILQIQNYGIGGYYDTHYDFAQRDEIVRNNLTLNEGNRIATVLIYMSDVEMGGETAFTRLGIKGSVLFWHNLYPDGTGDPRTRHIACPVVLGTKWVGNHWIREKGQEIRHSCNKIQNNGI